MKYFTKKWTSLLLIALMLLTLTACGTKPETPAVTTAHPSSSNATIPSSTAVTVPPSGEADIRLLEEEGWINYNYGFSQVPMAFSDDGIYYTSLSGFLRYFDKATGLSVTLCQKAGCLHEEEEDREKYRECESIIGHPGIFFFWDGGIYYDVEDSHGHYLYRREADGTAQRKVAELCLTCRGEDLSYVVYDNLFVDGSLYYEVNVLKKETEGGTSVVQSKENVLLHLDLASGKERELLRMKADEGSLSILAGHKDAVLINTKAKYDPAEGGIEALYNAQVSIQLFSPKSETPKILLQVTNRELGHTVYLSGGELYSKPTGTDAGRVLNLLTGEQREYTMPGDHIYGDYYKTVTQVDEQTRHWTVYNAQTGQSFENVLKDIWCSSDTISDADGTVFELMFQDEESEKTTYSYCYVAFEDITDELQKEDFVEIISRSNRG